MPIQLTHAVFSFETRMKKSSIAIQSIKVIILFFGGLYLLGFGLFHSPNAKGLIDFLLPFEWVACTIVGSLFIGWSVLSFYRLGKNLL
jgi:hypothetical protein